MKPTRTRIALFGGDVSKSLSPQMHNLAFISLRLPLTYEAFSISPRLFKRRFEEAKSIFLGLNITIPHKEAAALLIPNLSRSAHKLQAINTTLFTPKEIWGDNTDIDGFVSAVTQTGKPVDREKVAFILGAGGAARATIEGLHQMGMRSFVVASRSPQRISSFENWFHRHYSNCKLECIGLDISFQKSWEDFLDRSTIFVNAAPLEACQALPFFDRIKFPKGMLVVDWVYLPKVTLWLKKGSRAKGTLVPGYKLLLYQGMKSFQIWTRLKRLRKSWKKHC